MTYSCGIEISLLIVILCCSVVLLCNVINSEVLIKNILLLLWRCVFISQRCTISNNTSYYIVGSSQPRKIICIIYKAFCGLLTCILTQYWILDLNLCVYRLSAQFSVLFLHNSYWYLNRIGCVVLETNYRDIRNFQVI